jgi:hypothetical protein
VIEIVQCDYKIGLKKRFCPLKQDGFRAIYIKTRHSYRFVTNEKIKRFRKQHAQKKYVGICSHHSKKVKE